MTAFALNQMTVARAGFRSAVALARDLGLSGIEARTDLPGPLFDGLDPAAAGQLVRDAGLRLHALAELSRFNDWSDTRAARAAELIALAQALGAEAIALIPRNDGLGRGNGERQANLRIALRELEPMLREAGLMGLVEPLGFETSSLREKREAADAIAALGAEDTFRLIHDTFHHTLAGGGPLFPELTAMVHVSGVVDPEPTLAEMTDAHRVLVAEGDRLGTTDQLRALARAGYAGPVSYECFSPDVHALADPGPAIAASIDFVRARLAREPA